VVARQRRHELGIRMALGADGGSVAGLIMRQGMRPALMGLVAGLAVAGLASGALSSLLYGVNAIDPLTFGAVTLSLSAACAIACAIPAWRASRADVVAALRSP
jgi:ABC-type antimicrobial peptide transport system permease subunit